MGERWAGEWEQEGGGEESDWRVSRGRQTDGRIPSVGLGGWLDGTIHTMPGTERWQQQSLLGYGWIGLVRVVSLFQVSVLSRGEEGWHDG